MTTNKTNYDFLNFLGFAYLAIPVILFFAFWLKYYFAIPFIICISISLYYTGKNIVFTILKLYKNDFIKLLISFILICIWVYLSGIGKYVWQNDDHWARNLIFETLINYSWPIVENGRILTYYIGFWIPSACFGKLFGITAGYFFQYLWAVLGISLVFCYISTYRKKISIWPLVLFIFFSGMDYLGLFAYNLYKNHQLTSLFSISHIEWWALGRYQYSSFTTQLFWVYNQAIPAWLAVLLLLNQKDNRNIAFLIGTMLFSSTFPAVGILPIAVYFVIIHTYHTKELSTLNHSFSFQNCVGGIISGIVIFLYLRNNSSSQQQNLGLLINSSSDNLSTQGHVLAWYLIFLLLEFFIYAILIVKFEYKNPLYYIVIVSLIIIPFIKIGNGADFCMRASIPDLILLYIFVLDFFSNSNSKILKYFLIFLLIIGSITAVHELLRTVNNTFISKTPATVFSDTKFFTDSNKILNSSNFSSSTNTFFYKYFIKK